MKVFNKFRFCSQQKSLSDKLILVNDEDKVLGPLTKLECHLTSYNFSKEANPHRAFSNAAIVEKQIEDPICKLLVQYLLQSPDLHREFTNQESRRYQKQKYQLPFIFKESEKYARERLKYEIHIEPKEEFHLINKVLYRARSDSKWSEYELDYIYFCKLKSLPTVIDFNTEEVSQCKWIERNQLEEFMVKEKTRGNHFTPWFELITQKSLLHWWEQLENDNLSVLKKGQNDIIRL